MDKCECSNTAAGTCGPNCKCTNCTCAKDKKTCCSSGCTKGTNSCESASKDKDKSGTRCCK
ncbi:metallothionein-B-like [Brachyhypopomus gauderio]|uniref:metallothionein-B-like n=1 Tax=Brachyhypopomus gauderio TaxID=698409 RepID=UPI0040434409